MMLSPCILPQSTADCVKHYYLCKKNEHFKQLVRKANLKRRKTFVKPQVSVILASQSVSRYRTVLSAPRLALACFSE